MRWRQQGAGHTIRQARVPVSGPPSPQRTRDRAPRTARTPVSALSSTARRTPPLCLTSTPTCPVACIGRQHHADESTIRSPDCPRAEERYPGIAGFDPPGYIELTRRSEQRAVEPAQRVANRHVPLVRKRPQIAYGAEVGVADRQIRSRAAYEVPGLIGIRGHPLRAVHPRIQLRGISGLGHLLLIVSRFEARRTERKAQQDVWTIS